ncbi:outer membrane lipoprotein-sorting protein [Sphingobacteriales bacterium UPWRP_1]|nr:hypothetical protein B6N25_16455 [Sphingobacteriales bacterium TSM_CSS]PSJ73869.1 outer membrane lipoprotein-sorting protein [Sphingobacteriales bacterium UPWRP_1]
MKKFIFCLSVLGLLTLSANGVMAQSLDEVLKNHFEAIGQEQISKLNSFACSGKVIVQGGMISIPMTMTQKRPDMMKTESTFQGQQFIEAYDGKTGWSINPFAGALEPQLMNEDQLRSIKIQSDIDGQLYNYAQKGYKAELEGSEDMEGSKVYKVKLTNANGEQFTYYIDADSYVLLKTKSKVKIQGNDMESETFFSNYKQLEGMAFAYNIETKMQGQVVSQIVIEDIKLNPEIDNAIFTMPKGDTKTASTEKGAEKPKDAKPKKSKKKKSSGN